MVLDKAGKLKGPALLGLLGLAALMTLPLALGNAWVKSSPWGILRFSKSMLMVSIVAICYSCLAIWISPSGGDKGAIKEADTENSSSNQSQAQGKFTPEQVKQFQSAMQEAINNSKPPNPVKHLKADNRPFAFAIDVALFSPSRDKTVLLYLASRGAEGMCIYPANLALYLRLQNLQEIPSRLAGWNLELAYGADWVRAVELDSRFGTMYLVTDSPKNAGRLDNSVGFDGQLMSRSHVLKPREIVEGWALFQYPKAHPFFAGGYKLTVWDTLGHKWSGVVSWPDPKQANNLLGGSLKFTGMDDVSTFRVKYADE